VRRVLHILLLIALTAGFTPFRTCVVEQVALGSSCHDEPHASSTGMTDVHSPTDSGDSHHCQCERPKTSGERQTVGVLPVDLAPQVLVVNATPLLRVEIAPVLTLSPHRERFASLPLPLLI
jgi:hypothetical protein